MQQGAAGDAGSGSPGGTVSGGMVGGGMVRGDEAEVLLQGPLGAQLLAGADRTGGTVSFVIHPLAPRALGSPVHTHRREDEWSFVLDGEVGMQLGDQTLVARPGDLVLKPRDVPHAFWNPGDRPARFLEVITPGGFEGYFGRLGELFAAGPEVDPGELAAVAADYGLEIDPASVPRLAQEHGLEIG